MERSSVSEERQYTLQELADSAGVSIRTIRYYIGEGLLPGPEGAGPQSHYTESHARRLQAINLLKDRYLPLREIRRQLTGLDDAQIDELIAELGGPDLEQSFDIAAPMSAPLDEPIAEIPRQAMESPPVKYDAGEYIDALLPRAPRRGRAYRETNRVEHPREQGEIWRRIEVADGVELLVREEIYARRKDQLDWLTDWARKVVD